MKNTAGARALRLARQACGFYLVLAAIAGAVALNGLPAGEARAAEPPPPQSKYFFRTGSMVKASTAGFACVSEAAFNKANGYKYGNDRARFDAMFAGRECGNMKAGEQYKIVANRGGLVFELAPAAGANVWSDPYFFEPAK